MENHGNLLSFRCNIVLHHAREALPSEVQQFQHSSRAWERRWGKKRGDVSLEYHEILPGIP